MLELSSVWGGFGAGSASTKVLTLLFVGDFDESSPPCAAPRQISLRNLDLTRQNARSSSKSGFVPEWAPKARPRPFEFKKRQ
ncbi:hypothetical protein [Candidatus Phycosocius spiralis]|uniref:hypothetical protein n=1 Tax=Candidatus Phycosocius spiralis TaxID=2815099 RepID=UPI0024E1437C|nr:hypothetical protein [Candidatus Phycosocius spiralis]